MFRAIRISEVRHQSLSFDSANESKAHKAIVFNRPSVFACA